MPHTIVFDVLEGLHPQRVFVSASLGIHYGDEQIDGRIFLAERRGEVAVCASFGGGYVGATNLAALAARGELTGRAVVDYDANGLAVVSRLQLSRGGSRGFVVGQPAADLEGERRAWVGHIVAAKMAAGSRATLPVPMAERPLGEGEPIVIDMRGEIGDGKNTADDIRARLGNSERVRRAVVANIESSGGACAAGLAIYRALAAWPYAVYAVIRKAESMAAIISLAADVRSIVPTGTLMLHRSAVESIRQRNEATDLRRLADDVERIDQELAGIIALRTGNDLATAREWLAGATTFNAGAALDAGLVHAVDHDDLPAMPRALRARFAPIGAPFATVRATR